MSTRKPLVATRKPLVPTSTTSSSTTTAVPVRKPVVPATSSIKDVNKQMSHLEIANTRRRLSIISSDKADDVTLDGDKQYDTADHTDIIKQVTENAAELEQKDKPIYTEFHSMSKVGYVPFNPGKVNQDRACEVAPFGKSKEKAFFGVFDGHGQLGHLVSQFVATNLPKYVMRQKDLETSTHDALASAFLACNNDLASSGKIDCTFSGTTGVTLFINGQKIICANVGDSRAVLAREVNGKLKAVHLSNDHKPDREDERRRIIKSNGRVEACKAANGMEIGPARVWIKGQDVPGLAMTRSFGDLVAASVGVIARPEIEEVTYTSDDKFIIMGSDGIWEFITSQEAVDIAVRAARPEQACQLLLAEAERRWKEEEDVVDDITVLVISLTNTFPF